MRTKVTIMTIVLAIVIASIATGVALLIALGPWAGLAVSLCIAAVAATAYRFVLRTWHASWGATNEEVDRAMPGDELLPGAASTTRAITIRASAEQIWPWLVQIGYGRAGWYSYDWIDNDWKPSADRILLELQSLEAGDRILMAPGMGPEVKAIEENRYILSAGQADSWCLALYPSAEGSRLVSRWRQNWPKSPATYFWIAISDPGAFIMERKMLKGIKHRVEAWSGGGGPQDRLTTFAQVRPKPIDPPESSPAPASSEASIDLYWLPLGAGGWFVRLNGRIYEAIHARLERRRRLDLYHSALEVRVPEGRFVIENSWPIPDADGASRGVVVEGPVGSRRIARFRAFRYEVRRWRDGVIADADEAAESPQHLSDDPRQARRLLDLVGSLPSLVWGRDELETGEMWNSNSVVSWLLAQGGLLPEAISPPAGGRAPGWEAGLITARREQQSVDRAPLPLRAV